MESLFSGLSSSIKDLYETFFLRDFLGKLLPGLIIATGICIFVILADKPFYSTIFSEMTFAPATKSEDINLPAEEKSSTFSFLVWLVFISVSYLIGYCNQTFSENIGIHSAHPYPRWRFFKMTRSGSKARIKFERRLAFFKSEKEITSEQKKQRERYLIIKEMSGNMTLPFFIVAIFSFRFNWLVACIFILLSVLIFFTHKIHRTRQYRFEKSVLKQLDRTVFSKHNLNLRDLI